MRRLNDRKRRDEEEEAEQMATSRRTTTGADGGSAAHTPKEAKARTKTSLVVISGTLEAEDRV